MRNETKEYADIDAKLLQYLNVTCSVLEKIPNNLKFQFEIWREAIPYKWFFVCVFRNVELPECICILGSRMTLERRHVAAELKTR